MNKFHLFMNSIKGCNGADIKTTSTNNVRQLFNRIEKCLIHFVFLVMMNKCTKFHKDLIYHLWEISLNAKVNLRWFGERTNKTEKLYAPTKLVGYKNEIQFIITLLYVIIHSNIFEVRRYQMIINNCISFSLPLGRNH